MKKSIPRRVLHRIFRIRTLVVTISLVALMLPIAGIVALRLFENLLHRQTESKLSAEAAYIQALYFQEVKKILNGKDMAPPLVKELSPPPPRVDEYYNTYPPTIDVSIQDVLPPGPPSYPSTHPVDPVAKKAGLRLAPILTEVQRSTLSGIFILDVNGTVITTLRSQGGHDLSGREEVARALKGNYCAVLRRRELTKSAEPKLGPLGRASRVRVYVAVPMLDGDRLAGVVYLHRTSLTFFRDIWEDRFSEAVLVLVGITVAISLVLSYLVTRPLKTIIRRAERIAEGEPDVSLEVGLLAPAEAHQLSEAMETMVTKLQQRMDYVEQFARNVSHEFKTPIAGIQGAIELLREGWEDMTDDERRRFLAMIESDARRMELLVRKLLELTRIEATEPERAVTDLARLLEPVVARYREAGHDIRLEIAEGRHLARIAADMAETVAVNLIDNALTHGRGKEVTVVLTPGPRLMVSDRGPGVSAANLPRIFDRFFTTARESGGTGLGLAIVRAIVESNRAQMTVASGPEGTAFTVDFRPAEKENGQD